MIDPKLQQEDERARDDVLELVGRWNRTSYPHELEAKLNEAWEVYELIKNRNDVIRQKDKR